MPTFVATPATPGAAGASGESWEILYYGADSAAGMGEIGPFTDIDLIDGKPFFRFEILLSSCASAPSIDTVTIPWM